MTSEKNTTSPIITALDYPAAADALAIANQLDPEKTRLKVGKELFTSAGPSLVEQLQKAGFDVFLDLKFHDIPNTVAGGIRSAMQLGVWMVDVHISGGRRMLDAAVAELNRAAEAERPLLIGITVLTSMTDDDLAELGLSVSVLDHTLRLARLAATCQIDGVVCSPHEAAPIKAAVSAIPRTGKPLITVTPGVRPVAVNDDQRRVMTPTEALTAGSDYLVIGRPITTANNPLHALESIVDSISNCEADHA